MSPLPFFSSETFCNSNNFLDMTLVCEDAVIIKTLSSNDNFFILKFFGKAFRQHKLLWCDPGPWWWHQSLAQIENHLDWLSAHLDQLIIEKGQQLNTYIQTSKMGCVRIVDFVCLFIHIDCKWWICKDSPGYTSSIIYLLCRTCLYCCCHPTPSPGGWTQLFLTNTLKQEWLYLSDPGLWR